MDLNQIISSHQITSPWNVMLCKTHHQMLNKISLSEIVKVNNAKQLMLMISVQVGSSLSQIFGLNKHQINLDKHQLVKLGNTISNFEF